MNRMIDAAKRRESERKAWIGRYQNKRIRSLSGDEGKVIELAAKHGLAKVEWLLGNRRGQITTVHWTFVETHLM